MGSDVGDSGRFRIGGERSVHRLGFGAMRLTGEGIWGEPRDRGECKRVLERLPELGIDFVDTADSYGPFVSEELIGETLAPYGKGTMIATKGGLARHGPNVWVPLGRPEYLRQCVLMSLRRLRVQRIELWQLHRIDPKVPRDEQLGVMAEMQREGLVNHLGLSEVGIDDIEAASKHFRVATVQNQYNLAERQSEDVLDYCERRNIGFIPWYPLAAGALSKPGGILDAIAKKRGATASQIALAWVLGRSPVVLPIPGTSQRTHLEENVAAAAIALDQDEFRQLDAAGRKEWERRKR